MSRRRVVLLAFLALASVAFAVAYALRDTTPPQVYAEVPGEAPAGLPLNIPLSADEPVSYLWRYGSQEGSLIAQSATVSFQVEAGQHALDVTATDSAENFSSYRYPIYGIPEPTPSVFAPERIIPGEPFSVRVGWDDAGAEIASLLVEVEGEARRVFVRGNEAVALASAPLGAPAGVWPIRVALTDAYGRTGTEERTLSVLEYPQAVEDLDIPGSILSRVTPEGRALEQETMNAAYQKEDEQSQPLWNEPFLLPIEGRSTSGFGSPRRYAAGGNVSYHYGADIAAPEGTPIRATNRGRVLVAGFYPIKGGFVVLDHGAGVYSLYLHQSKVIVEVGQVLERGDILGEVGTTGLSTGPHLHWEMRVFGEATDPLAWVGKLLP